MWRVYTLMTSSKTLAARRMIAPSQVWEGARVVLGPLHDEAADAGDRLADDAQPRRVLHKWLGAAGDEDRPEREGCP